MAELVANCPRCGAQSITFDLTQSTLIDSVSDLNGMTAGAWEAFCVCRRCHGATIFVLSQAKKTKAYLLTLVS